MAQILLKETYLFLREESFDKVYQYDSWNFNTDTLTVTHVSEEFRTPLQESVPGDYSIAATEEFHYECLQGTTTKRGYYHDGEGSFTTQDTANSSVCGYQEPVPDPDPEPEPEPEPVIVYGCTDPDATNYNPNATHDNNSCIIPNRMVAVLPPPLTVAGSPVVVTLQSGLTGKVPVKATALLTLGELTPDTALTVNGVSFKFSLTPKVGEFYDAQTLAQALLDEGTVSDRYAIEQPDASTVMLTALLSGSALTPDIVLAGGAITAVITPGVDELRSQAKQEWGCYVELWGCDGLFGAQPDKNTAVLIERTERLYAPGNRYRFDIAADLRLHTSHGLFTQSDRMKSYFIRYGEVFVPTGQTQRRRQPIGESDVLWAMEGALPLQQLNELSAPLLLNKSTMEQALPLHSGTYAEAFYILVAPGTRLRIEADFRYYDGSQQIETPIDTTPTTGGVHRLSLQPVLSRAYALQASKRVISCTLTCRATYNTATVTLGVVRFQFQPHEPHHKCMVFLSSLGAYDTLWLQGISAPAPKRAAQLYGSGIPADATSSSRSLTTHRVQLQQQEKLHSGLLSREGYETISKELAASPEMFVYADGSYSACTVIDIDMEADLVTEEYYITFTVEPGLPFNPISN